MALSATTPAHRHCEERSTNPRRHCEERSDAAIQFPRLTTCSRRMDKPPVPI